MHHRSSPMTPTKEGTTRRSLGIETPGSPQGELIALCADSSALCTHVDGHSSAHTVCFSDRCISDPPSSHCGGGHPVDLCAHVLNAGATGDDSPVPAALHRLVSLQQAVSKLLHWVERLAMHSGVYCTTAPCFRPQPRMSRAGMSGLSSEALLSKYRMNRNEQARRGMHAGIPCQAGHHVEQLLSFRTML